MTKHSRFNLASQYRNLNSSLLRQSSMHHSVYPETSTRSSRERPVGPKIVKVSSDLLSSFWLP